MRDHFSGGVIALKTSPLNCIQELAPRDAHYPWRVMVTCILLNQTHGRQVRPIIDELWKLLPHPGKVLSLSSEEADKLRLLLRPLGLVNRRSHALYCNARDYVAGVPLHNCYGMGQYGRDAIDIFVHGKTDLQPTDKWLTPYLEWRRSGGSAVQWGGPQSFDQTVYKGRKDGV